MATDDGDEVVAAALQGLRQAFKLDGLLVAIGGPDGSVKIEVAHRDGIDRNAPELMIGRSELNKLLRSDRPGARWGHYRWVRGRYLWLRGPSGAPSTRPFVDNFGIAAARRTRLSPVESTILSDLCQAIVRFKGSEDLARVDRIDMEAKTRVAVRREAGETVAEVHATWALPEAPGAAASTPPSRRVGLGRAADPAMAVAQAAAKAARPRCQVVHAGVVDDRLSASEVQGRLAPRSLALIRTAGGDLRLALASSSVGIEQPGLTAVALAVLVASLPETGGGNEIDLTPTQFGRKLR